ncbi:MAG TPA: hypothetical protein VKW08_00460 [Xanthobacteraceae bacterium]|jgi:hypothetical protein|nr:hypothetical protein [Xanthobacteraceae bacterium]
MQSLKTLFGNRQKPTKARRSTERGEIYDIILSHLNPPRARKKLPPMTYGRLGYLLTDIPTKDLYALISHCDDAERRGFPWSAIFWKEIRPQQKQS